MTVLGVDGCRGGWVAAMVGNSSHGRRHVDWEWTDDVAPLLRRPVDRVGIDIPIGLPDAGPRACDVEARAEVGARRSSVFTAPVRPVLQAPSYAAARALLAAAGGASMSAQAFGIVKAVAQVDAALAPDDEDRVAEVHPEVSFAAMARGCDLGRKRTAAGAARRLQLLAAWLPDVVDAVTRAPTGVPLDDALDALACAWSASRWRDGQARALGDGARDARGLVMRIVV